MSTGAAMTPEELNAFLATAFPYGELDGLLGAQATFEAVYSVSDGKLVQVDLTNKVASY